jgi:hypothetical protein
MPLFFFLSVVDSITTILPRLLVVVFRVAEPVGDYPNAERHENAPSDYFFSRSFEYNPSDKHAEQRPKLSDDIV